MSDLSSRISDFAPLALEVLRSVAKVAQTYGGLDITNWRGPEIAAQDGTYKLSWYPSSDDAVGYLTVYDNGVWDLEAIHTNRERGTHVLEGKLTPLHHSTWIRRLIKKGTHFGFAYAAVYFFKELKNKKR